MNHDYLELRIERTDTNAFRLVWIARDGPDEPRSIFAIMETSATEAPYWSTVYDEIPADRISAPWAYDIGKAIRTNSIVRKIIEQWSEQSVSLTVADTPRQSISLTVTVAPPLTPLAAKMRLEKEGPFICDKWKYEWNDDWMSPISSALIWLGSDPAKEGEIYEFCANGEIDDPIDESPFWVLG